MRLLVVSAIVVATGATGFGQSCGELVGDWPAGSLGSLVADGARFVVAEGASVVLVEPDPEAGLAATGHVRLPSQVTDLALAGEHVLAASGASLQVLDMDAPALQRLRGNVELRGGIRRVRCSPPVAVAQWIHGGAGPYSPFETGIDLVDVTAADAPVVVGTLPITDSSTGPFEVVDTWLYRVVHGRLQVFDLSDPSLPTLAAELALPVPSYPSGALVPMAASATLLAVSVRDEVILIDVTERAAPAVVATYQAAATVHHAVLAGDHLLLRVGADFEVVDVTTPAAPVRTAALEDVFSVRYPDGAMAVAGAWCGVVGRGTEYPGLTTFDVTVPSAPTPGPRVALADALTSLAVADGRVVAGAWRSLWLGDVVPTGEVERRSSVVLDDTPTVVDLRPGLAFAGFRFRDSFRLEVYAVEPWPRAELVGALDVISADAGEDYLWDVIQETGDGWVAVALDMGVTRSRLAVVDVSEPAAPVVSSILPLWGKPEAMTAVGDLLYLAFEHELVVVDVGEAAQGRGVAVLELPGFSHGVTAWGRYVFVEGFGLGEGIRVVDVGDPSRPALVGGPLPAEGSFDELHAGGGLLLAFDNHPAGSAEWRDLLALFDLTDPASPTLSHTVAETACARALDSRALLASSPAGDVAILAGGECGIITLALAPCRDVDAAPTANFTVSPPFPEVGEELHLVNHGAAASVTWAWDLGDGTTSTEVEPRHAYAAAGTYHVSLVATDEHGSAVAALPVTVVDPSEPPVASFTWSVGSAVIGEPLHFTDRSSGGPSTWRWSFGDGFTSTARDPSHVFPLAGEYEVSLAVASAAGASSTSTTVAVAASPDTPISSCLGCGVIPGAAATAGLYGTRWRTDLTLHNANDFTNGRTVYFLPCGGHSNSGTTGVTVYLQPFQTMTVEDVVGTWFGLDETAGALLVIGDDASAHTFTTDVNGGTYGQGVPLMHRSKPWQVLTQVLVGLREDADFRSNVGFVNPTSSPITAVATAYSQEGAEIGRLEVELEPLGDLQVNRFLTHLDGTPAEQAYVVVDDRGNGLVAYGSIVDNGSGDAVFVPAQDFGVPPPSQRWYVPAVAAAAGVGGTRWQSELVLLNPDEVEQEVVLTFLERTSGSDPTHRHELTLAGGQMVRLDDVVHTLFGLDAVGALMVESTGPLHATSRTFTTGESGTFGQNIPAVPASELLIAGDQASLIGLREDDTFRSNFGLVSGSSYNAVVVIDVFDELGTMRSTERVELAPWEHRQVDRILRHLGGASLEAATLHLTVELGSILAYSSVVDNRSGDPVFAMAINRQQ